MAESKKTTRGSNFVKNFGRTAPALELLLKWVQRDFTSAPLQNTLLKFFQDQAGADDQLKFWHCGVKQFPKWNERMITNSSNQSDAYLRWADQNPEDANIQDKPLGTTDPYLHPNPLEKDDWAQPFHIIHTREITNRDAARAALVAIDHDELLRGIFRWSTFGDKELNNLVPWDGSKLLGLDGSPSDELKKAKRKWFIPKGTKWEQADLKQLLRSDQKNYPITVVSDSVVRTINWWLQKVSGTQTGQFNVHRIGEITDRIRSNSWPTPQAIKSYRIDWPVVRNLEEAALITGLSQTKVLTDLVSTYAGRYVAKDINNAYEVAMKAAELTNADSDEQEEEERAAGEQAILDGHEAYYDKYRAVVANFDHQIPDHFSDVVDTATISKSAVEKWMKEIAETNKEQAKLFRYIAGIKRAQPRLFPKDHDRQKGGEAAPNLDQVSKASTISANHLLMVNSVFLSPIPFDTAEPEIYHYVRAKNDPDGVPLPGQYSVDLFVGYEGNMDGHNYTYESLCEEINEKIATVPNLYDFGYKMTPNMILWANQNRPIPKKGKIICPDPRTVPSEAK